MQWLFPLFTSMWSLLKNNLTCSGVLSKICSLFTLSQTHILLFFPFLAVWRLRRIHQMRHSNVCLQHPTISRSYSPQCIKDCRCSHHCQYKVIFSITAPMCLRISFLPLNYWAAATELTTDLISNRHKLKLWWKPLPTTTRECRTTRQLTAALPPFFHLTRSNWISLGTMYHKKNTDL